MSHCLQRHRIADAKWLKLLTANSGASLSGGQSESTIGVHVKWRLLRPYFEVENLEIVAKVNGGGIKSREATIRGRPIQY